MRSEYLIYKNLLESGLIERHNDLKYNIVYTPKAIKRKRQSYLYVMCGYFPGYQTPIKKIGFSCDYALRYKTVQRGCPYPIFLDYVFPHPFCEGIELSLHRKFKDNRIKNQYCKSGETEWFVGLSDIDIISSFVEFDYNPKKDIGYDCLYNSIDYSSMFKPCTMNYFSKNIDYRKLVASIDLDRKFSKTDLIISTTVSQYLKQPKPQQ
jgi:hypothetical protein